MQFAYDDVEISHKDAIEFILDFGKHRGTSLGILAERWETRGYLKYILSTDPAPGLKAAVEVVLEITKEPECTLYEACDKVLYFGKFKGSPLRDIVTQKGGMNYLMWCSNWEKCDPYLKKAISVIQEEYARQKK
jgi:hypothetical protein